MVEENDISYCFGKNVLDEIKFKLLTALWTPDEFLIYKHFKKTFKISIRMN